MKKYNENELKELAKGVFKSQPNDAVVYASESGNFLNEDQYNALSKDDQKACTAIENPNVKKAVDKKADKAIESAVKEATEELTAKLAIKDTEIKALKTKLKEESKAPKA